MGGAFGLLERPEAITGAIENNRRTRPRSSASAYRIKGPIFYRPDGSLWRPSNISLAFRALVRRTKLKPFTFHRLRHTHASHLLRHGVHPKVVSERLGHASVPLGV